MLAFAAVAYAAILAGTFLVYAVNALERVPNVIASGSPIAEIGIAIGAVLAGLGALIASVRYLIVPKLSEVVDTKRPAERR